MEIGLPPTRWGGWPRHVRYTSFLLTIHAYRTPGRGMAPPPPTLLLSSSFLCVRCGTRMIRWRTLHGPCMIANSGKRRVTTAITKLPVTNVTTVRTRGRTLHEEERKKG